MKPSTSSIRASARTFARAGSVGLPFACAVHCLVTPFLPLFAGALELGPVAERLVFGCSLVLSAAALRTGWQVHHKPMPWLVWAFGIAIWSCGLTGVLPEWLGGTIGGGTVGFATLASGTLLRRAGHTGCECPACDLTAADGFVPSEVADS
jgi:hypothetical protein